MKLKIFLLPAIILLVLSHFFGCDYVYLDDSEFMVEPGSQGSPTLQVMGKMYYVKDWEPHAGCYLLTQVGFIDYNIASEVNVDLCTTIPN